MTDGGAAFPVPEISHSSMKLQAKAKGMSLRDYFAAAALQGILASGDIKAQYGGLGNLAYAAADNLLQARAASKVPEESE